MSLMQSIPLTSLKNARELGGYRTADGRKIKNGVLLRTAKLSEISSEDIDALRETYRLQHLIDFRMPMEINGDYDPVIDGAENHHINVLDFSSMVPDDIPDVDISSLDFLTMVELTLQSGLLNEDMYFRFLLPELARKAYSEFFQILLETEPDRAVLWHCTSGKDRTGLAAMLLLSALGADEELIINDYLLTNEYNAEHIKKTKQYLKSQGCDDEFINKAVLVFDAVDGRFLRCAIECLKREYGSVLGYIRDGLNISNEDINSLKEKYLV